MSFTFPQRASIEAAFLQYESVPMIKSSAWSHSVPYTRRSRHKGTSQVRTLELVNAITVIPIAAPALTCLKCEYHGNEMNGFQSICSDAIEGGTEPGCLGSRNEGQACGGETSANYLLLSPNNHIILDAVRAVHEKDCLDCLQPALRVKDDSVHLL